ncbi:hypothetical protein [Saccharomonospora halophila]|uniref:hypothetical protein n=1 Tax=Saccharomonospora halophila TaxID=129922 RepID=UPI00036E1B18|nr:hypothetical protein [Saccharomonospora halophila]
MSVNSRVVEVTLLFEWRMGPWWVLFDDDDVETNYLPDEVADVLPLSAELVAAVAEWDGRLQRTYVPEQPQDSGFGDPAEYERFVADGRELARRVKRELGPDITVLYESGVSSDELVEL